MRRSVLGIILVALIPVLLCGCTGIKVKRNPSACDTGIRYYRPKPCLLLSPVQEGQHNGQGVAISLVYLPDYSEEYSLHLKTGINGKISAKIGLENGWNLTSLDMEADPQTDDLIKAVGDAIPKVTAGGGGESARFTVEASNVPLGYYEAVTGRDEHGCKQLYGWRYIGFFPYATCPKAGYGSGQPYVCDNDVIYGLVWQNRTLVFKPVQDIAVPAEMSATGIQTVPETP